MDSRLFFALLKELESENEKVPVATKNEYTEQLVDFLALYQRAKVEKVFNGPAELYRLILQKTGIGLY